MPNFFLYALVYIINSSGLLV